MKTTGNLFIVSSAWIAKIVNAVTVLLVIRIITSSLGSDYASVFIILTGLLGWYMLADLGIGSSIQNFISECRVLNRPYVEYLRLATQAGTIILLLGISACYLISSEIGVFLLANFTFLSRSEMTLLFFVSASLYISMAVGSIGYKIWYAERRGYLANIAPACGGLLGMILVYFTQMSNTENKMLLSVIAFLSPPAILALLSLFYRGGYYHITSRCEWEANKKVLRRGLGFFLMNLMQVFIVNIDYIILAAFATTEDIIIYGVVSRIFGFLAFFYTSIYTELWPRFSELFIKKEWQPVRKLLFLTYAFSALMIFSFLMVALFCLDAIINFIVPGHNIEVSWVLIILFSAYHLVIAWVHGFGIVLQSMSDAKTFLIWMPVQAVINFILQLLLVPTWGIAGVVSGMMLSFILTLAWVLPLRVKKVFHGFDR